MVFHLFIQLMTVTLEEKEEDFGSEQLVMLMVMMRVSLPGQKPKILKKRPWQRTESHRDGEECVWQETPQCHRRAFKNIVMGHGVDS